MRGVCGFILKAIPIVLMLAFAALWLRSYRVTDYMITAGGGRRYCLAVSYWGFGGIIVADPWPGDLPRQWEFVHGDDSESFPECGLTTAHLSPWPMQKTTVLPRWRTGVAVTSADKAGEPIWPPEPLVQPRAVDVDVIALIAPHAVPAIPSAPMQFRSVVIPLWLPVAACALFPLFRCFRYAARHDLARYRRSRGRCAACGHDLQGTPPCPKCSPVTEDLEDAQVAGSRDEMQTAEMMKCE